MFLIFCTAEDKNKIESSISKLKAEVATLKSELDALKRQPDSTAELKAEVTTLKSELDTLKNNSVSTAELKTQLETYKAAITNQLREIFQVQFDALKKENAALKVEVEELKKQIPTSTTPPTTLPPDERIFYLKPTDAVFISNDSEQIPAQISKALNVDDMKNFLIANDSEISKKFQKLISLHLKAVQSFADKLKLKDLDDEELSETVTSKYFKLFQQIIFDNLLLAIQRGVKTTDDFYTKFLAKLNAYLEQCGIYTVNAESGVKATDDDYKNMSLQNVKTSDKNLAGVICQIERLPYRINYLDEFGEQKFFQYNGMMSLYKAV